MTHGSDPKFTITGREYNSFEDLREARAGGEDRGQPASYSLTADNAEQLMIIAEGLPDPGNVLDDGHDDA